MKETAFICPIWNKHSLLAGRYALYSRCDFAFSRADLLVFVAVVLIVIFLVAVPLILYIVTLIISLVDQRRFSKILYMDTTTDKKNWLYFTEQAERKLKKNGRNHKYNYVMACMHLERYQNYCLCFGQRGRAAH